MSPLNFRKLQDKHVLVIGGSSGIGLGVAEGALASGANVTISSSSQSRVDAAASNLKSSYADRKVAGIAADLGNQDTLEAVLDGLFKDAAAANGTVNHVVFTAADALVITGVESLTPELLHKIAHMRMVVPFLVAKVAARYLPKEKESSLTFTSGSGVEKPTPGWSAIAFVGNGVVGLTRALAVELAPVRVNVVQPGYVDTPLWKMDEESKQAIFRATEPKLLTGKVGHVEDVAEAYLWVLKDSNVTGTVAKTDAGILLT